MAILVLDHSIQLTTFKSLIQELQETVNLSNKTVLPYLPHINALLLQTVTVCRVAEKSTVQQHHLTVKDFIPPGKTVDRQWRFKQTAKNSWQEEGWFSCVMKLHVYLSLKKNIIVIALILVQ